MISDDPYVHDCNKPSIPLIDQTLPRPPVMKEPVKPLPVTDPIAAFTKRLMADLNALDITIVGTNFDMMTPSPIVFTGKFKVKGIPTEPAKAVVPYYCQAMLASEVSRYIRDLPADGYVLEVDVVYPDIPPEPIPPEPEPEPVPPEPEPEPVPVPPEPVPPEPPVTPPITDESEAPQVSI